MLTYKPDFCSGFYRISKSQTSPKSKTNIFLTILTILTVLTLRVSAICGDGIVKGGESDQCDLGDQNGLQDSGCTTTCQTQQGYTCTLIFQANDSQGVQIYQSECSVSTATTPAQTSTEAPTTPAPTTQLQSSSTTTPSPTTTNPVIIGTSTPASTTAVTQPSTTTPAPTTKVAAITTKPAATTTAPPPVTTQVQSVDVQARLEKCNIVASNFYQTDFSQYDEHISSLTSKPFSCRQSIWSRKLKVSCSVGSDSEVYIRVQTNSMPDHCIYLDEWDTFPNENLIDFKVKFNLLYSQLETLNLNSYKKANDYVCGSFWAQDKSLKNAPYKLQIYSGKQNNQVVGVMLNGIPIFSGLSDIDDIDVLYSQIISTDIDQCLGSFESTGFYHYYSYSPCILPSTYKSTSRPSLCGGDCDRDPLNYAISQTPQNQRKLQVIGIAKDGHMIYGPYKSNGILWQPCEMDACNGVRFKDTNEYAYVLTKFYPYTVGCWGPSTVLNSELECTTNERVCKAFGLQATMTAFNALYNINLSFIVAISLLSYLLTVKDIAFNY